MILYWCRTVWLGALAHALLVKLRQWRGAARRAPWTMAGPTVPGNPAGWEGSAAWQRSTPCPGQGPTGHAAAFLAVGAREGRDHRQVLHCNVKLQLQLCPPEPPLPAMLPSLANVPVATWPVPEPPSQIPPADSVVGEPPQL